MRKRKAHPVPAKIAAAQAQFEKWRQSTRPRSRIPERLWATAVDAAEAHGVYQTSRCLRLSYSVLKQHLEERRRTGESRQPDVHAGFVEVMAPLGVRPVQWSLELRGCSGDTLRLEVKEGAVPDVVSVTRGFWGRQG